MLRGAGLVEKYKEFFYSEIKKDESYVTFSFDRNFVKLRNEIFSNKEKTKNNNKDNNENENIKINNFIVEEENLPIFNQFIYNLNPLTFNAMKITLQKNYLIIYKLSSSYIPYRIYTLKEDENEIQNGIDSHILAIKDRIYLKEYDTKETLNSFSVLLKNGCYDRKVIHVTYENIFVLDLNESIDKDTQHNKNNENLYDKTGNMNFFKINSNSGIIHDLKIRMHIRTTMRLSKNKVFVMKDNKIIIKRKHGDHVIRILHNKKNTYCHKYAYKKDEWCILKMLDNKGIEFLNEIDVLVCSD